MHQQLTLPRETVEYVRVPVKATEAGLPVDPTADAVTMAFEREGSRPTTWHTAEWETDATAVPLKHYVRCIVGPGHVELVRATYNVWVKIVDSPEIPVLLSGVLIIS